MDRRKYGRSRAGHGEESAGRGHALLRFHIGRPIKLPSAVSSTPRPHLARPPDSEHHNPPAVKHRRIPAEKQSFERGVLGLNSGKFHEMEPR